MISVGNHDFSIGRIPDQEQRRDLRCPTGVSPIAFHVRIADPEQGQADALKMSLALNSDIGCTPQFIDIGRGRRHVVNQRQVRQGCWIVVLFPAR